MPATKVFLVGQSERVERAAAGKSRRATLGYGRSAAGSCPRLRQIRMLRLGTGRFLGVNQEPLDVRDERTFGLYALVYR